MFLILNRVTVVISWFCMGNLRVSDSKSANTTKGTFIEWLGFLNDNLLRSSLGNSTLIASCLEQWTVCLC